MKKIHVFSCGMALLLTIFAQAEVNTQSCHCHHCQCTIEKNCGCLAGQGCQCASEDPKYLNACQCAENCGSN